MPLKLSDLGNITVGRDVALFSWMLWPRNDLLLSASDEFVRGTLKGCGHECRRCSLRFVTKRTPGAETPERRRHRP
jgi:hypothetical protein